jgi:hypothetical protein
MSQNLLMQISAFCPATGFSVALEYETVEEARARNPHLRNFKAIRYIKK